nr:recombinase family protein [Ktedonobacter racemifer]
MDDVQVGIYARVSSDQQSDAKTVESQVSELRARVAELGLSLPPEHEFIDDGYSGATLIRPALERLRDVVAAGGLNRLFVHCPDRLARNYAHQVLLLEELLHAGVEVVFLNREVGQTPEDQLLLQVQGMISEYERAKILERSRRGKRHAAHLGAVSVLSGAPYGYRYVSKHDGAGEARFDVLSEEARVVRQVFIWVGRDRCSIGEVCRRLTAAKEHTRTGKTVWDRATVRDMLHNPAYKGAAAFGKTRLEPLRPRLRAQRGRPLQPRRAVSTHDMPPSAWLSIPVPALVDDALFDAVQEQLSAQPATGTSWTTRSALSAAGLAGLWAVRVCFLWESTQSQCAKRPSTSLCVLSLYWGGCLSFRWCPALLEQASPDRSARRGCLERGVHLARGSNALRARVSATTADFGARAIPRTERAPGRSGEAPAGDCSLD